MAEFGTDTGAGFLTYLQKLIQGFTNRSPLNPKDPTVSTTLTGEGINSINLPMPKTTEQIEKESNIGGPSMGWLENISNMFTGNNSGGTVVKDASGSWAEPMNLTPQQTNGGFLSSVEKFLSDPNKVNPLIAQLGQLGAALSGKDTPMGAVGTAAANSALGQMTAQAVLKQQQAQQKALETLLSTITTAPPIDLNKQTPQQTGGGLFDISRQAGNLSETRFTPKY